MPVSLRALIALLLALTLGAGGAVAAAAQTATNQHRAPAREARTAADQPRTTTVVEAPPQGDRSAPVTVLLVGAGAAVGVAVGVLPAILVAMLVGYLPPPRLRRRPVAMLVAPGHAPPAAGRPEAAIASAPEPGAVALAAVQQPPEPEPRGGQLTILAHARHQAVYDAAYAEQLERAQALRASIGARLRRPPAPPESPGE